MTTNVYREYADSARSVEPDNEPPPLPCARPLGPDLIQPPPTVASSKRDPLAVASAVCGFTGFIPVVTQVIGIVLGVAALLRIRRSRRAGIARGGTRFAITGLVMNGFTLVGWIALGSVFAILGNSLSQTSDSLSQLLSTQ